jgi:hypothetical protein
MTTPDAPDAPDSPHPHHSPGRRPAPGHTAPAVPSSRTGDVADLNGMPADESAEEAALRELLHGAVADLRPAPHALDHLRRAVPARRQHRRQALAGSAAAVLLVGTAVPALIHAAGTGGKATTAPANVATTHPPQPGEDGHTNTWGTTGDFGQSGHPRGGAGPGRRTPAVGGTDGPSSLATTPGGPPPASTPDCSGDQLGQGTSNAGSLDAGGRAYGWFRVANVSSTACVVPPGPATVQVYSLARTDLSQISVVGHTAGDAATELPAGSGDAPLVLAPGADYEVDFVWVPADAGPGGCPPETSPPVTPTPTDTPTGTPGPDPGGSGDSGGSGGSGGSENLMSQDVTPGASAGQPAAVSLRHAPPGGAAVVFGPTLQGACAGTVYTTAPIPAMA